MIYSHLLCDNFSIADLAQAVRLSNGKLPLEASGNIDENTILAVAKTGVDYISTGSITNNTRSTPSNGNTCCNCVKFSTSTIKGKLGYFCMADLIAQPIDPAAIKRCAYRMENYP
jgi:hypothetical protein